MFELNPRLEQDSLFVGDFKLCMVRLMNDARYPWLILIPKREGITEAFQLDELDQQQLNHESLFVAKQLSVLVDADKMNIAALGNVVSQLHIHHVARYQSDEAWPAPVWGKGVAVPYGQTESEAVIQQLRLIFSEQLNNGHRTEV
jgi:diadenosine tetraphosphate (Ap4A) HIT family hydrolase